MDLSETPSDSFRRHPWETARVSFFEHVLKPMRGVQRVLDVGSGDAYVAATLKDRLFSQAHFTCWDEGYRHKPMLPRDGFTFTATRPEGPFDLALLLDVLEHVEDDAAFLSSVVERVAPGGSVLVSVPTWPRLFSSHDERLGHHRRYLPSQAKTLVRSAGLQVVRGGGLFHALLPVRAGAVALERVRAPTPHEELSWTGPEWIAGLVEATLAAEGHASRLAAAVGLNVPGLSWWALCRRP